MNTHIIKFCTVTDILIETLIIHEARVQAQGLGTCFLPFECIFFLNENYSMRGIFFSHRHDWVLVVFILNSWAWKGMIPSLKSSVPPQSCENPTSEPGGAAAEKRMKGLSLEKATGICSWFCHVDRDCQTLAYSPWSYGVCSTLWKSACLQQGFAL